MKLCFFGKIRGKIFLTQIWVFGSFFRPPPPPGGGGVKKIFYWSPAFRICTGCLPKYEWNLTKIGFKTTYFQVFPRFSTGLQLSEYVQVVCRNMIGTCLKSVSKPPTFMFFRDFQLFQHPAKLAKLRPNLCQYWPKRANLKFNRKKDRNPRKVPFIFHRTTFTYSESWGPVENFFSPNFA